MKKILFPLLIGVLVFNFQSCKKSDPTPDDEKEILLRDSTYFYTHFFSLWNDHLPDPKMKNSKEIDLQAFTAKYKDAEEVLDALIAYMPKDNQGRPVDRFSFIDRSGSVAEEIGQGLYRDVGISPVLLLMSQTSNDVGVFIRLVQKNSPAAKAGLKRGLQITAINGTQIKLTVDNNGKVNGNTELVNKLFSGESMSLNVYDHNEQKGSTASLTGGSYKTDPILADEIIQSPNGKKVGYFAYNSFISIFNNNGQPNDYHADIVNAFNRFTAGSIQELVIDLRYNGGGSTSTAEFLTNLIVPSGNNGQLMYKYEINSYLNNIENIRNSFQPVNINKKNTLNLPRVYFLVTSSTASASELVINSLQPYMNVEIISTNNGGTHGKPTGFFGYPVVNGYADLYITSFKMTNKNGFGDYYTGLIGTKKNAQDGYNLQIGDPEEAFLAEALYHIQHGTYRSGSASSSRSAKNRTGQLLYQEEVGNNIDNRIQGLYKFSNNNFHLTN